jgi:shikimate kinase
MRIVMVGPDAAGKTTVLYLIYQVLSLTCFILDINSNLENYVPPFRTSNIT